MSRPRSPLQPVQLRGSQLFFPSPLSGEGPPTASKSEPPARGWATGPGPPFLYGFLYGFFRAPGRGRLFCTAFFAHRAEGSSYGLHVLRTFPECSQNVPRTRKFSERSQNVPRTFPERPRAGPAFFVRVFCPGPLPLSRTPRTFSERSQNVPRMFPERFQNQNVLRTFPERSQNVPRTFSGRGGLFCTGFVPAQDLTQSHTTYFC